LGVINQRLDLLLDSAEYLRLFSELGRERSCQLLIQIKLGLFVLFSYLIALPTD
jgi:hypothetical protein